ncbi:alpha/beta hydrolase [Galbibacter mesophilus]|uniref:alpha/beta hydrolase n=1 Tax=Galbibacter mesophilus TaxID=379069 RepID=UPI00191E2A83|nr:alpha/beta hydrolase [Galbibacter mesophilus]MCM5663070.1 alpha/beta hydrolase [Galbibacter mesophilus]
MKTFIKPFSQYKILKPIFILITLFFLQNCFAQNEVLPLWKKVPNQRASEEKEITENIDIVLLKNVQKPQIDVYLPSPRHATGEAVLIFPGGGYHVLAYDWEGQDIAKWLNSKGIAGIIVKYRLPVSKSIITPHKAPLQDAQRAMRLVKHNAEKWNINKDKIGIIGFSAGGHLASTLSTHYNESVYTPTDEADSLSAKPSFSALIYPVISFKDDFVHQGSKNALLGESPDEKLVNHYSNQLQVDGNTPRTFLVHAADDKGVPVENSLTYFNALKKNNVPTEMHIYPEGSHGFGLGLQNKNVSTWTSLFINWMQED